MIKKLFLYLGLFMFMFLNINAVTTINSCPSSWTNGETYLVSEFFASSTCTIDANNIIIKQENPSNFLNINLSFFLDVGTNLTIENFNINSLNLRSNFENTQHLGDVIVRNNTILNLQSNGFLWEQYQYNYDDYIDNLIFENNFITSKDVSSWSLLYVGGSAQGGTGYTKYYYINNLELDNNTFLNGGYFVRGGRYLGSNTNYNKYFYLNNISLNNNILDFDNPNIYTSASSSCVIQNSNNNFMSFGWSADNDLDHIGDSPYVWDIGSCNVFTGYPILEKDFISPETQKNSKIINYVVGNPNYFQTGYDYYLSRDIVLDSTNYLSLNNLYGQTLYIMDDLEIIAVNTIRFNSNTKLEGYNNDKSKNQIHTSGTINSIYDQLNPESSNFAIMTYNSKIDINNLYINLVANGNYGLIKRNQNTDGQELKLINNDIIINFVPTTINTPVFFVGYKMSLINNYFSFNDITDPDYIPFFKGSGGGLAGGHYIVGNTFDSGGLIFQYLSGDPNNDLTSKYINNNFVGRTPSLPYDNTINPTHQALEIAPKLNGSYFYKTNCDSYEFNIGNYYQDLDDLYTLNDTDNDGIDNVGWFRGYDLNSDSITDYRVLMSYPYDFNNYLGTAVNTWDLCAILNFNIISPIETNYSSGTDIVSNWEYSSATYSNLFCTETINNYDVIYTGVNSGDNMGRTWDISDGQASHTITCCDTIQCDNIVRESPQTNFCVGDCAMGIAIVYGTNTTPSDVYGCTDSQAINYNPLATIDDNSCDYNNNGGGNNTGGNTNGGSNNNGNLFDVGDNNIIGSDVTQTSDNAVSFVSQMVNGLTGIALPIGAFLIAIFVILGVVALFR